MEALINELISLRKQLKEVNRDIAGMRRAKQTPRIVNLLEQANEYRNYLEEDIARIENQLAESTVIVGVIINLNEQKP